MARAAELPGDLLSGHLKSPPIGESVCMGNKVDDGVVRKPALSMTPRFMATLFGSSGSGSCEGLCASLPSLAARAATRELGL